MKRLTRTFAPEEGMTVIVAIQVLAVMLLLTAAVVGGALSLSSSTRRDARSKGALAAANAGLEVARFRLNRLQPLTTKCLTDQAVDPGSGGAAAGECPFYSGDLGNGVTYRYYVTPIITTSGVTCAGSPTTPGTTTAGQRCITAVGTSAGVTRRVQTLVRAKFVIPIFPFSGMVGLNSISINENGFGDINGPVGTNGTFTLSGCNTTASVTIWDPAPGASMSENCSGSAPLASPARPSPYTLTSIAPAYTGTESPSSNDNSLFNAAGFNYAPASRTLSDDTNSILTLDGPNSRPNSDGMYVFNLCSVNFTHGNTEIRLLNGAMARFLVDDSTRPGSGCSGQGTMNITNTSCFNMTVCSATPTPGPASALQFFQYGSARIDITNKAGFSGAIYAPNAQIKFTNKSIWYGGIAALSIDVTNGLAFYAADVSGVVIPSPTGLYTRTNPGWVECQSTPTTASDPESGC